MSSENDTKIKNIMRLVHQKGVVTAVYLRRHGVSYQSMLKYRKSNWLRSLGNGAFCESGDVPSIDAALAARSKRGSFRGRTNPLSRLRQNMV